MVSFESAVVGIMLCLLPLSRSLPYTFQFPACATTQECQEDETLTKTHGEYFCSAECYTDPDFFGDAKDSGCLFGSIDPSLCKSCLPKSETQKFVCQPCCRCWELKNVNSDEYDQNMGCVDLCPGNIKKPTSWLDCDIMYGGGGATGGWGDRLFRAGSVAAGVLVGGAAAIEGGV
ncbi:hypothetical protein TrRE_jg7556 [Triparma retinervis]|uniref:Uncharacterized protein n=1 Tax=Triparma retinervis TaxID=2557542 RepID=A0A9W7AU65_9STRA|nr:hypothetical protein TrRE_jg7556 [Triparma retinervis]